MDLWVVAAAAGAGYIAKNLQNLSLDEKENPAGPSCKYTHNIQSGSRNLLQQLREKTCPLRRLSQKMVVQDDSEVDFPEAGVASATTGNIALEDYSKRLLSTSPPVSSAKEERLDTEDAKNKNVFQRAGMKKLSGSRRCRTNLIRPLKSCLDEKTEDDKPCFYSSNSSTIRPLLVTDATRIINGSRSNSSFSEFEGCKDEETRKNGYSKNSESSCLERFESVEEPRKSERNCSQEPDTSLLFVTAMTVGILSATSAWKTEVDTLNKQLKYMRNLVQDLHEELDMKEMLMVKDLTNEAGGKDTPLSIEEPIASPLSGAELSISDKCDGVDGNDNKYTENLELLSKIEAELEAELEMLENNMKGSSVELGTDSKRVTFQEELKSTVVNGSDSEDETTKTNHCQPVNYSVPPWELSFRLHELIESRLQTRINELEAALSYNQSRDCGETDLYSDAESSSSCECYESENTLPRSNAYVYTTDEDQDTIEDKQRSSAFITSDEDRASDDESEILLIKKIAERWKLGSSKFEILKY